MSFIALTVALQAQPTRYRCIDGSKLTVQRAAGAIRVTQSGRAIGAFPAQDRAGKEFAGRGYRFSFTGANLAFQPPGLPPLPCRVIGRP